MVHAGRDRGRLGIPVLSEDRCCILKVPHAYMPVDLWGTILRRPVHGVPYRSNQSPHIMGEHMPYVSNPEGIGFCGVARIDDEAPGFQPCIKSAEVVIGMNRVEE